MKSKLRKIVKPSIFAVIGALIGYIYYFGWGCTTGCAITSNPYITAIYGGVIGILLSVIFTKEK